MACDFSEKSADTLRKKFRYDCEAAIRPIPGSSSGSQNLNSILIMSIQDNTEYRDLFDINTNENAAPLPFMAGFADSRYLPLLSIARNIGALSELGFTPGALVYDKETELSDGKQPLEVTVLNYAESYQEDIPFGSGFPRSYATAEEVERAGGSTMWVDGVAPTFTPVMRVQLLVKAPDFLNGKDYFPFQCEDSTGKIGDYSTCQWFLRKTTYNSVGRTILGAAQIQLRKGIWLGKWHLTTAKKTFGRNTIHVPQLKFAGLHDDKMRKFILSIGQ